MSQFETKPAINAALDDALAQASSEADEQLIVHAWILLGVEHYARLRGRSAAQAMLRVLSEWVREAQPSVPWKE